jgi:hypothetical protein
LRSVVPPPAAASKPRRRPALTLAVDQCRNRRWLAQREIISPPSDSRDKQAVHIHDSGDQGRCGSSGAVVARLGRHPYVRAIGDWCGHIRPLRLRQKGAGEQPSPRSGTRRRRVGTKESSGDSSIDWAHTPRAIG